KIMAKVKSVEQKTEQASITGIRVTVGDLVGAGMQMPYSDRPSPLTLLANQPMPPKYSYRLSKIIKAVGAGLETYQAEKLKLLEQYGTKNKETDAYDLGENLEEFQKQHRELIAVEVTIPGERIALESLGNIEISASDILALHWLIADQD